MKGLILSGGKGTRLYPITYTSAKQMVPVANRPILFRVIDAFLEAGITDLGIVVGDTAAEIQEAVGDGSRWGAQITYIPQEDPLGLAHAVKISQPFVADQPFVTFLGDNLIEGGISALVRRFQESDWNCQVVLKRVSHPERYGVAELDNGRLVRLLEKPEHPPSDLALVGIYMFDDHVFDAVDAIEPSWRGELEITDAIQHLLDAEYRVHAHVHEGWWIDTGKREDLLEANRLVLETLETQIEGAVDERSQINGKVSVERGAQVKNSVVRGPACIGEDTVIENSYIGPYTSIYHHVLMENSEIEHSIVMEETQIVDVPVRIEESVIGRRCRISRSAVKPLAYKMTLGDNSQVGLL